MTDTDTPVISMDEQIKAQAQLEFEKSTRPKVKSAKVISDVSAFLNSKDANRVITYNGYKTSEVIAKLRLVCKLDHIKGLVWATDVNGAATLVRL